jgi:lipoprotein-anchoring transpeptidase ErfK/SrfK
VDKSQNTLILKTDEEVIKTYIVSTGLNNSTPTGNFKIVNKLQNPTWFKAGAVVNPSSPENILGSRWLGFDLPGYGIHGTTEPQSLGKQVTQGCIRMANSDVEELYAIVAVATEVTIVD